MRELQRSAERTVAGLLRHNLTLASAESCTGGMIGDTLTEISGVSQVYLGGVIAYANAAKMALLAVPAAVLKAHGAVSAETAQLMALGARQCFSSSVALATTGIAGPGGGTPDKPVGLVYVALATPQGVAARRLHWDGDRHTNKQRSVLAALDWLNQWLDEQSHS